MLILLGSWTTGPEWFVWINNNLWVWVTWTNCCPQGGVRFLSNGNLFVVSFNKALFPFHHFYISVFPLLTTHNISFSAKKHSFDHQLLKVNAWILSKNKSSVNTNSVFSYFFHKIKKSLQCDFALKKFFRKWKKHVFVDFFK